MSGFNHSGSRLPSVCVAAGLGISLAIFSSAEPASAGPIRQRMSAPETPAASEFPSPTYEPPSTPYPTPTPPPIPTATPTPRPTSTPTPPPTPSPSPTATPTPPPTPPPTPAACKYETGTFKYVHSVASLSGNKALSTTGDAQSLSCIDKMLTKCSAAYGVLLTRQTAAKGGEYAGDDYMATCWSTVVDESKGLPKGTTYATMVALNEGGIDTKATFVMDNNCNGVRVQPKPEEICGTVAVQAIVSPISLLWDDTADINTSVTVTSFPLRPGTGKFYTWKASTKAPLLVHDPMRTGQITDASQLFGEWTFGGKRIASLNQPQIATSAWSDGYEALGSLDADRDGAVSGGELAGLSLWFDENQNGVSELGEVKTLEETGVTKLFYKANRTDPATNDHYADLGFERSVSGAVQPGASVDWYGAEVSSPLEAGLTFQLSQSSLAGLTQHSAPVTVAGAENLPDASAFIGAWRWKLTESNNSQVSSTGAVRAGVLFFKQLGEGEIVGMSAVESSARDQAGNPHSVLVNIPLRGSVTRNAQRTPELHFALRVDGTDTTSSAVLSNDGTKLLGTSTTKVAGSQGIERSVRYAWEAERIK